MTTEHDWHGFSRPFTQQQTLQNAKPSIEYSSMRKISTDIHQGLSTKKSCTPTPNTSKNQSTSSKQDLNMSDSSYQKYRPNTTSKNHLVVRDQNVWGGVERDQNVRGEVARGHNVWGGVTREENVWEGVATSVLLHRMIFAQKHSGSKLGVII